MTDIRTASTQAGAPADSNPWAGRRAMARRVILFAGVALSLATLLQLPKAVPALAVVAVVLTLPVSLFFAVMDRRAKRAARRVRV